MMSAANGPSGMGFQAHLVGRSLVFRVQGLAFLVRNSCFLKKAPPLAPDGVAFGIASDDGLAPANGGQANKLSDPQIKSVVVFTLTVPDTIETPLISNVSFQYGTSLSDANITPSPTGVVGLASLGLMGGICCLFRRLRRSVKRSQS